MIGSERLPGWNRPKQRMVQTSAKAERIVHTAILVAAIVAFAGAGLALLVKRGHAGEGALAVA